MQPYRIELNETHTHPIVIARGGKKMSFGPKTIGLNFNISCLNEMVSNNYQALKKTKSFRGILNMF